MADFENSTNNTLLSGTGGNDDFYNRGKYVTIVGGAGKDTQFITTVPTM